MRINRRRLIAMLSTVAASVAVGVVAAVVSVAADTERIGNYWVDAELTEEGLRVTEVIDYDFGVQRRHGIYRNIPDVVPGSVRVSSPTAPDHAEVTVGYIDTTIKIGDAGRTITGRHRYQIDYVLERSAVVQGGLFSFDAVGFEWTVPIERFHVEVIPNAEFTDATCASGTVWSDQPCPILATFPGIWSATVDGLDAGDGVTISGRLGAEDSIAVVRFPRDGPAPDPGLGIVTPFLIALAAALAVSIPTMLFTRRAGRERIWSGGAADAAWGEIDDDLPSERVDEKELAELATIEFEPPRDMSAVEGALIIDEKVHEHHMSAWLLESAIRDEISISGKTKPVLHRGEAPPHPSVHPILDAMFGGRKQVKLGTYDERFTEGWGRLKGELNDWLHGSAHWDSSGRHKRTAVRMFGVLGGVLGLAVLAFGAYRAGRTGEGVAFLIIGGAIAGAGATAVLHSFELLVRTEAGSAYWLRVESFRRFLHNSEARHVNEAAEKGMLRHYTAWAVALDEADNWFEAVDTAARADPTLRTSIGHDLAFVTLGSHIVSASHAAATAPSSSGGGGGFGGGVGGGGGGGGGGSW